MLWKTANNLNQDLVLFFPLIEIYLDVIQIETYLPVYKTVVIHDSKYLHIGNLSEQTAFPFFYECGMAYCSCIVYGIQSKLKGFKERTTIRSGVSNRSFSLSYTEFVSFQNAQSIAPFSCTKRRR